MIAYTERSGVHIAYEISGDGDRDILLISEGFVPIELMEELPSFAHCLRRLRSIGRLITFDRRGVGTSDPFPPRTVPSLDDWVDDAVAVLDEARSASATVIGSVETAAIAILLAATHPERVARLVLINCAARATVAPGYEIGYPEEVVEELLELTTSTDPARDGPAAVELNAPSLVDDPVFRRWWDRAGRSGASPRVARTLLRLSVLGDVRAALPAIGCPVLVIRREGDRLVTRDLSQYVADHVPDGRYVEVPGEDDLWVVGDTDAILDEIERFVTGTVAATDPDRMLATILVTDIVGSTQVAHDLGDRRWRELLDSHDDMVRRQLERYDGDEIKTTGDGFLATFRGPTRAAECALAIQHGAQQLGVDIRAGIHLGEVELRGRDISGVNVNAAARVAAAAGEGRILVSAPVMEVLRGTDVDIEYHGDVELRGFEQPWPLYRLR